MRWQKICMKTDGESAWVEDAHHLSSAWLLSNGKLGYVYIYIYIYIYILYIFCAEYIVAMKMTSAWLKACVSALNVQSVPFYKKQQRSWGLASVYNLCSNHIFRQSCCLSPTYQLPDKNESTAQTCSPFKIVFKGQRAVNSDLCKSWIPCDSLITNFMLE